MADGAGPQQIVSLRDVPQLHSVVAEQTRQIFVELMLNTPEQILAYRSLVEIPQRARPARIAIVMDLHRFRITRFGPGVGDAMAAHRCTHPSKHRSRSLSHATNVVVI